MKKKTLILDCDNVTIDWSSMVIPFLISRGIEVSDQLRSDIQNDIFFSLDELNKDFEEGFLAEYHRSIFASEMFPTHKQLPTLLNELKKHYNLVTLTSFSDDPKSMFNRLLNIERYFPDTFEEVKILYALSPKEEALIELSKKYDVAFFIDDNIKHVEEGIKVLGEDRTIHFSGNNRDWPILAGYLLSIGELNDKGVDIKVLSNMLKSQLAA